MAAQQQQQMYAPQAVPQYNQQPQTMYPPQPAPQMAPPPIEWVSYMTPQGQVYYYNERTGEQTWQLPPGARCRDGTQPQAGYGQAYGQQQQWGGDGGGGWNQSWGQQGGWGQQQWGGGW